MVRGVSPEDASRPPLAERSPQQAGLPQFLLPLLAPPPMGRGWVLIVLGVLSALVGALVGAEVVMVAWPPESLERELIGAVVGLAAVAIGWVLAYPRVRPPSRLDPIEISGGRLRLPRSLYRPGTDAVDLRQVLHLAVSPGPNGHLEVLTHRRRYRIPVERIQSPDRLPELGVAYGQALVELDGGRTHLETIETQYRLGQRLSRRTPYVTRVLLGLIALVFALQGSLSSFRPDVFAMAKEAIRLGANVPALNASEPWRLLTATFLHGSLLHAYMNAFALWALGGALERLLGPARFLSLFGLSAACGALMSSWASVGTFSVGASGGIFGLLGGLAALHLLARDQIPPGYRQSFRWWGFIVGVNVLLPVLVPVIDAWGHFGGAAAGLVLGVLFVLPSAFRPGARADRTAQVVAAVTVAAYSLAVGLAIWGALRPREYHQKVLAEVLLKSPGEPPLASLRMAARILRSDVAPSHLKLAADDWIARAASSEKPMPEVLLARSERQEAFGQLEAAIALRWRALAEGAPGAWPALVDGLMKLDERPLALGPNHSAELRRAPGDDRLELLLEPPVGSARSAFFLELDARGLPKGVLEWPIGGPGPAVSRAEATIPASLLERLEAGGRLELALWAAPPLVAEATLHGVVPSALSSWRRTGDSRPPLAP